MLVDTSIWVEHLRHCQLGSSPFFIAPKFSAILLLSANWHVVP
jgi:hypothetical protein